MYIYTYISLSRLNFPLLVSFALTPFGLLPKIVTYIFSSLLRVALYKQHSSFTPLLGAPTVGLQPSPNSICSLRWISFCWLHTLCCGFFLIFSILNFFKISLSHLYITFSVVIVLTFIQMELYDGQSQRINKNVHIFHSYRRLCFSLNF